MLTDTDPAAPQVVLIGEGDNVPQALLDAANNVVALSARTPPRTIESRCMSPEVALFVPPAMSAQWSLSGAKRTSHGQFISVASDPISELATSWVKSGQTADHS